MKPFRIPKSDLMERVQSNRDAHREVYEKAMDGYRGAAMKFFGEQLERAKDGKPFMTVFTEPMPEDHTGDYDLVLEGWAMTQDSEVELDMREFRQYVQDEWGWKKEFMATSANYIQ